MPHPDPIAAFIDRWSKAEADEHGDYAHFISKQRRIMELSRSVTGNCTFSDDRFSVFTISSER